MVEFMNQLKIIIQSAYDVMNIPIQFTSDFSLNLWEIMLVCSIASILLWGVYRIYNND